MKTYSLKNKTLVIGGFPFSGFGENDAFTLTPDSPDWDDTCGALGEVTRSKNFDRRATIKITLMQNAVANSFLESMRILDAATGSGALPWAITDGDTGAAFSGTAAWVKQEPETAYAQKVGARVWEIRTDSFVAVPGPTEDNFMSNFLG